MNRPVQTTAKRFALALEFGVIFACSDNRLPAERNFAALEWDTLFQVGTQAPDDTILLSPIRAELWQNQVVVIDLTPKLIGINRRDGRILWQYSRKGKGPGELVMPYSAQQAPNGNLWVLDPAQARIVEFDQDGTPVATHTLNDLGGLIMGFAVTGDRAHFITLSKNGFRVLEVSVPDFKLTANAPFPWPDSIPFARKRQRFVVAAAASAQNVWAAAYFLGPGFIVWKEGAPSGAKYIDPIPFDPAQVVARQLVNDTSRWGAHQMNIVGQEVFILFGGRPHTREQAGAPIELVDVYSLSGRYLRSYRLPYPVDGLATDGEVFYALTSEPYPMLQAIRPQW